MKQFLLLAALVPVLIWSSNSFTDEASGAKRPLDLPAGGTGTTAEDEDLPETINFFGSEYEGDGFFWCFSAYEF
jgi:hypothetical protein